MSWLPLVLDSYSHNIQITFQVAPVELLVSHLLRKSKLKVSHLIKENFQLSKITCKYCDVISLYRSQDASYTDLNDKLSSLIDRRRSTLIIGDFNFCYIDSTRNLSKTFLHSQNFIQMIENQHTLMEISLIKPIWKMLMAIWRLIPFYTANTIQITKDYHSF